MQLTNGNLYWPKKSKIERTYPYITRDRSCDVLVIGGGITGAITAYFLASEGAKVIVAEKNILGYGSTLAATAMLEYQMDIDMHKMEKMIGQNSTKRIYKLCLDAIDKIENINENMGKNTGFKRQDALYYSSKFMQKGAMAKEYEIRKNAGFNTIFLDSHHTINLNSGILTKNASGVINPYLFTQVLFEYMSNLDNVEIYENTKIEDVKCKMECVECRTSNNFKIVADNVIFSSGYDTLKYIPNAQTEIYKTFTIVSKPIERLTESSTGFTARDTAEPYHYMRFDGNGRILFGGENIKFNEKLTNNKYLLSVANDRYRRLYSSLQKTMYNLDDIPIEYAFNATVINTKDTLPIIDEIPNMPNCFCNLGYGSNGILYSVIGANMLKDAIRGFYTKDMNMFKINR